MSGKIVVSGARPTGDLHLGNYFGALHNWVKLQHEYDCYFFIADWHALTTGYAETETLQANTLSLMADFLAAGLDPDKATIFLQSQVLEHAELYLLLGMNTPVSWLERTPTYKEQQQQMTDRDLSTYGFLGYPALMAADILIYKADFVPVGEDQLPHLEISREMARRFNFLYGKAVFPEPKALLTESKVLPGIDGRKMSKSYNNTITFADSPAEVARKVMCMITDPARIRKDDPGHPEVCSVFAQHKVFSPDIVHEVEEQCRAGTIGCVACKRKLQERLLAFHQPIHEKRTELLTQPDRLRELINAGSGKARAKARSVMTEVRQAVRIGIGD